MPTASATTHSVGTAHPTNGFATFVRSYPPLLDSFAACLRQVPRHDDLLLVFASDSEAIQVADTTSGLARRSWIASLPLVARNDGPSSA